MKTQRVRRLLSIAAVAALVIPASAVVAQSAQAATPPATTHWVSPGPVVVAGQSCNQPGYNSIQAAVDASASGDTIRVCPGTYTEQVTITRSLKLQSAGAPLPVIQAPASPAVSTCNVSPTTGVNNLDIVDICGTGTMVTMTGFVVQGPFPGLSCAIDPMGIAVVNSTLNATNVAVNSIRQDPLNGCQGGIGILIGRQSVGQTGTATLKGVTVSDYQKGGIEVSNAGSKATISGSAVTGVGPTDQIASNGLEVVDGALAKVTSTSVTGNECNVAVCGPDAETQQQATGILLYDPAVGTSFWTTTLSANDIGMYNYETTSTSKPILANSSISGNRYEGVVLDQGNLAMSGDAVSGSLFGVQAISYSGQTLRPAGTMTRDTFTANSTAAVSAVTDGPTDSFLPKLTVNSSSIDTSNAAGVVNRAGETAIINAKSNWWGDASGPGDWSFGSGAAVSDNVNFFPWATASNLSTYAKCTLSGTNIKDNNNGTTPVVLCGTSGNNFIHESGSAPALLLGNGGNDQLLGGSGNDYLIGGAGHDVLNGGLGGVDSLQGRGGGDTCTTNNAGDRTSGC